MKSPLYTIKNLLIILVAFVIVYTLSISFFILVPLVLALFFVLLVEPFLIWLDKKNIHIGISLLLIFCISIYLISIFGSIFYETSEQIIQESKKLYTQFTQRITPLTNWAKDVTQVDLKVYTSRIWKFFSEDWLLQSSKTLANFVGHFGQLLFMTSLYFFALVGGILNYRQYINNLSKNGNQRILQIFESVKKSINTYIIVKFWVSLSTGIIFSLLTWIFGVDFPLFWGIIAFLLNFIPTLGSFIATIPPILLGFIQIDSSTLFLSYAFSLIFTQVIFGAFMEPRMLGERFSINTVFVILSLVIWGTLWGIVGMILSTPILVLIKTILDEFPEYRLVSKLIEENKGNKKS